MIAWANGASSNTAPRASRKPASTRPTRTKTCTRESRRIFASGFRNVEQGCWRVAVCMRTGRMYRFAFIDSSPCDSTGPDSGRCPWRGRREGRGGRPGGGGAASGRGTEEGVEGGAGEQRRGAERTDSCCARCPISRSTFHTGSSVRTQITLCAGQHAIGRFSYREAFCDSLEKLIGTDVSSIKEMVRRWFPSIEKLNKARRGGQESSHR